MSEWKNIQVEDQKGIRIIRMNRPEQLNALNPDTLDELHKILQETRQNQEVGVVVLTGEGEKAFVAGADIKVLNEGNPKQAKIFAQQGHQVFSLLEEIPQPVIAAVNGFALGGGCELALACDFVYASNNAMFGLPEVKLGLIPGFGGTQRLMRKIPMGMARELIYTGNFISAEEAHRIGLVNQVCEPAELLGKVLEIAKTILKRSSFAVEAAKKAMVLGFDQTRDESLALEIQLFTQLFETDHPKEGTSAFLEKRSATFSKRNLQS